MPIAKVPLLVNENGRNFPNAINQGVKNGIARKGNGNTFNVVKRPALIAYGGVSLEGYGASLWHRSSGNAHWVATSGGNTRMMRMQDAEFNPIPIGTQWTGVSLDSYKTDMYEYGLSSASSEGDIFIRNRTTAGIYDYSAGTFANVHGTSNYPTDDTVNGLGWLDGYIVVATAEKVFHSDADDPTTWNALAFVDAESSPDTIRSICNYRNHIVVFSQHSIEFLYNTGAGVGSVLAPRREYTIDTGVVSPHDFFSTCVYQQPDSELVACIATNRDTNGAHVAIINNFKLEKISTPWIDQLLTSQYAADAWHISGWQHLGKSYIEVMIYIGDDETDSTLPRTFVYDVGSKLWYEFVSDAYNEDTGAAEIPWQIRDNLYHAEARAGAGTTFSRSLVTGVNGNLYYLDHLTFQDVSNDTATSYNISTEAVTGKLSGDAASSNETKFQGCISIEAERASTTNNVAVSWSDDDYETFNTARTMDISIAGRKICGGGSFIERAYKLVHNSNAYCSLHALRIPYTIGS